MQSGCVRIVAEIAGNVQGVGFRPFVFKTATTLGVRGSIANTSSGVVIDAEGSASAVAALFAEIADRPPPLARIDRIVRTECPPIGHAAFLIAASQTEGHRTALVAADVAVCDDCLRELFDPADRRYGYPFINCTNCGPRYTIVAVLPYDRPATTMACFAMCAACAREYADPLDRRFHAQPIACPACGPRLWLMDGQGKAIVGEPLATAASLLHSGAIVAVKGLGGFHLACDACNADAVAELRRRKHREEKPLAVMVPDLAAAERLVVVDAAARALLTAPQRPIVLLERRPATPIADLVAPGNRYLGIMLAYTPVHHLLLRAETGSSRFSALVMTSGNASEEPIAIGNREAVARLSHLADALLLHDRDILTRCDDSVVRPISGNGPVTAPGSEPVPKLHTATPAAYIRRARGYVPLPVFVHRDVDGILAVGGQLKNVVALGRGRTIFLSQHLGDLENLEAYTFFRETIGHLETLLEIAPTAVAYDLHPDYLSTTFALENRFGDAIGVQHHHAHVAACMAEHGLVGPVLGLALDGTGYGTDGRIWGGELLRADYASFTRVAHLREVPLPGGEAAVRQPWRMALSWLDAVFGSDLFGLPIAFVRQRDQAKAAVLLQAIRAGVNCPLTSSCGRLFDAVAALIGLRETSSFEGQAAMELEMLAPTEPDFGTYRIDPGQDPSVLDPASILRGIVDDLAAGTPAPIVSQKFHNSTADLFVAACEVAPDARSLPVVLSGGCMQNEYFVHRLSARLTERGFRVYTHQQVPPNDGGLALGQVMVAAANRGLKG